MSRTPTEPRAASLRAGRPLVHVTTVHPLRDPRIAAKAVPSLRAAGFDVRLVARHIRSEVVDVAVGGGVAQVPVEALSMRGTQAGRVAPGRRALLQREVARVLDRLRPALVHLHDPELLPLGRLAQRRYGARVIYDRHEAVDQRPGVAGRALARLERWAFGWLDHTVIAEASYAEALPTGAPHTLVRNYALAPASLPLPKTVPKRVSSASSPAGPLHLVYAGTVTEARGLPTMLDALRRARAAGYNWQLSLVGRCPRPSVRERAEGFLHQHRLYDHVSLVGWTEFVPPEAMTAHLAAAHVGLCVLTPHPNYVRSMPTKLYEYLQHALPFVCSDIPLWADFTRRTGAGLVCRPDDPDALVAAIRALVHEGYPRRSTAAAEAAPRYRWDTEASKLVALYQDLLASR